MTKKELAYIRHNINNPLLIINLITSKSLKENTPLDQDEIQQIQNQVERIAEYLRGLKHDHNGILHKSVLTRS